MLRVVGGWGQTDPNRRRARGAPRRAQLRRWICTCTSDPQPRQCRVVRARGGAAGSARSGPPRLSGAPCGRLRRCEPWCLLTPRTCFAGAFRRKTAPECRLSLSPCGWVSALRAKPGRPRRRCVISGPSSVPHLCGHGSRCHDAFALSLRRCPPWDHRWLGATVAVPMVTRAPSAGV